MSKDIISGGEALMRSLEYHGVKTIPEDLSCPYSMPYTIIERL